METPPNLQIRSLTGLRAVAAGWVAFSHASPLFLPTIAASTHLMPLWVGAHLAVDLFFVLSGFVLTLAYENKLGPRISLKSTKAFYVNRLARIYPVYLATLLFAAAVTMNATGALPPEIASNPDGKTFFFNVFMVQQWFGVSGLNHPAWSLCAEAVVYVSLPLMMPLLFRVGRNGGLWRNAALAVLALLPMAVHEATTRTSNGAWDPMIRVFGAFVAGSFTYYATVAIRRSRHSASRAFQSSLGVLRIVIPFVAVGYLWWLWRVHPLGLDVQGGNRVIPGNITIWFPNPVGRYAFLPFLWVIWIAVLALHDSKRQGLLGSRIFVLGGLTSYALYLVHLPTYILFSRLFGHPQATMGDPAIPLWFGPAAIAAAYGLSFLVWSVLEVPAQKAVKRALLPRKAVLVSINVRTDERDEVELVRQAAAQ